MRKILLVLLSITILILPGCTAFGKNVDDTISSLSNNDVTSIKISAAYSNFDDLIINNADDIETLVEFIQKLNLSKSSRETGSFGGKGYYLEFYFSSGETVGITLFGQSLMVGYHIREILDDYEDYFNMLIDEFRI